MACDSLQWPPRTDFGLEQSCDPQYGPAQQLLPRLAINDPETFQLVSVRTLGQTQWCRSFGPHRQLSIRYGKPVQQLQHDHGQGSQDATYQFRPKFFGGRLRKSQGLLHRFAGSLPGLVARHPGQPSDIATILSSHILIAKASVQSHPISISRHPYDGRTNQCDLPHERCDESTDEYSSKFLLWWDEQFEAQSQCI